MSKCFPNLIYIYIYVYIWILLIRKCLRGQFDFPRKTKNKGKEKKGFSLIVTYHPNLYCLSKTRSGSLHLLYMNDKVKRVFSPNRRYVLQVQGNYLVKGLKSVLLKNQLDHLNVEKNATMYAKMSVKLRTLPLQLRLRHKNSITE